MASVKRKLNDTLDDLEEEKLKRFKSYLREDGPIPVSVLEKADATDTVDQMLDRFGPERAVKITLDILKKMNQNHLAEQLENKHTKATQINTDAQRQKRNGEKQVHYTPVQMRDAPTGVNVDIKAETGASVNAPVLTANTFNGPVTIYGSNAAGN
ncbi:NACHT, LRR and PYD domains-containing protein 6-like, partial [Labeo rohita]|uniref:NACHT, LRR and PYD domains-containing protein 6-like n=1 Tax=Labeo rohita TaxID=84645 RepID=UPI0021E23811